MLTLKKLIKAFSFVAALFLFAVALAPRALAEDADDGEQTIVDIALGNDDFSILVSALQRADLVETLQGDGPFTVFAPTNAAFEALLADLDVTADELLAQPDLANVLTYHVVPGNVMAGDLTDGLEAETVNGETVTFDLSGDPMVNDSMISTTDIEASNGVIHVIDSVLVPSNFTLQEVDMTEDDVAQTGLTSNTWMILSLMAIGTVFTVVLVKREA